MSHELDPYIEFARSLPKRHREWRLGVFLFFVFLIAGKVSQLAEQEKWLQFDWEYQSFVTVLFYLCAIAAAVLVVLHLALPMQHHSLCWRIVLAVLFAILGLKAGVHYPHLCNSGSRIIEWSAMFGTPIIAAALVFFIQRRVVACILAASVVCTVLILARPYLNWAHGI